MKLGDPKSVGQMLQSKRHQLGFTIDQMAKVTGLSAVTLIRLEKGRNGYIRERTAKALELSPVPRKPEASPIMGMDRGALLKMRLMIDRLLTPTVERRKVMDRRAIGFTK